jgi:hypothetical protein
MELVTLRRLAFTNGETCQPAEVSLANHNRLSSSAPFDELAARTDFDIETGEMSPFGLLCLRRNWTHVHVRQIRLRSRPAFLRRINRSRRLILYAGPIAGAPDLVSDLR